LPDGADADIVAETVRAIIASAVSTERLVLETSPSLVVKAVIHVPAAPESEKDSENLWDVLMNEVVLEELPVEGISFPPDVFPLVVLCAAIQLVCQRSRVPAGVLAKSKGKLFEYFGIKEDAPRLIGLPVFELGQMDEDTVVVISCSSESLGPMRADHGVVFHMTGEEDGG